jgi:chitinase
MEIRMKKARLVRSHRLIHRRRAYSFGILVLISLLPVCPGAAPRHEQTSSQVVGYLAEGSLVSGQYSVKTIATSGAARMLTQLDYAFGGVANDQCKVANREIALDHIYDAQSSVSGVADLPGPNELRGTFHQLQELKKAYPHLKILISLGGWGQSAGFPSAAEPDHLRQFVRSCVDTFILGRFDEHRQQPGIFDGVDIDWEYPVAGGVHQGRPEDKANFTALVAEFRRQLDAVRPGLLLTAALPAEEEYYSNFELKNISPYLDTISIMAYDLHWNTERTTNFHSALFHDPQDPSPSPMQNRYGDFAVRGFLKAGVPSSKVLLGVPFYGKGWQGVPPPNHGLYQPSRGPAENGGSYHELKALPESADRHYFSRAVSCTVWNKSFFWSYDCPQSLREKMRYIRSRRLAGVMFWELSQDTSDLELLRVLTTAPGK